MIIAFPTNEPNPNQLESPIFNHFGSADSFVLVDTENNSIRIIGNSDKDHQHGNCHPLRALGGQPVDAVATCGIGKGALRKLVNQGIKVYRAIEGNVKGNLELLQNNQLPEFNMQDTCGGHEHAHIGGGMPKGLLQSCCDK